MSDAVVIEAPGEHRLVPHEPREPGPGEALVRVHAAGICGSDREVYPRATGPGGTCVTLTPGHEWSGTVARVGAGVPASLVRARWWIGEGSATARCATAVTPGETTLCRRGTRRRGSPSRGHGAHADAARPPPAVLPDDADLTAAALLEPAACIAAAALRANAPPR
ncbi:alcohol dehydrogenase catalytic domain-containing protein [Streptomyces thinghirensis]|nr:alcohol dehydrogenase catalytic domain-containing protein [Streptomyces thinghirensis]